MLIALTLACSQTSSPKSTLVLNASLSDAQEDNMKDTALNIQPNALKFINLFSQFLGGWIFSAKTKTVWIRRWYPEQ
jgi:hypothetical protein